MASLNVPTQFTDAQNAIIRKVFGEPAAEDQRTKLFDALRPIEQGSMHEIVRAGAEPVTLGLHGDGERKVLADGTVYEVDKRGCWRKV